LKVDKRDGTIRKHEEEVEETRKQVWDSSHALGNSKMLYFLCLHVNAEAVLTLLVCQCYSEWSNQTKTARNGNTM
jgi:hypothetical protein